MSKGGIRFVARYEKLVFVSALFKTWTDLRMSAKRIFKGLAGVLIGASLLAFFGYGTYSEARSLFWLVSAATTATIFLGMFLWNMSLVPAQWLEDAREAAATKVTMDKLLSLHGEGQKLQACQPTSGTAVDLSAWVSQVEDWRMRAHDALPREKNQFMMACSPEIFAQVGAARQSMIMTEALNKFRLIVGRVDEQK